jgi:hypothetical protein
MAFVNNYGRSSMPASDAFAVTPHDSTNFTTAARSLYVGVTGNVAVVTPAGTVVTFVGVPAGMILPVEAQRVNSTNTTATNIVGLV